MEEECSVSNAASAPVELGVRTVKMRVWRVYGERFVGRSEGVKKAVMRKIQAVSHPFDDSVRQGSIGSPLAEAK